MAEKTGFTMRLDLALLERVRNTIWAQGNRVSITDLIAASLEEWCEAQERLHNKGKPYPQREGELPHSKKKKT